MVKLTLNPYIWYELLQELPFDFREAAQEFLNEQDTVTFGDAIYTVISGEVAYELLERAWDAWTGNEYFHKDEVFSKLPADLRTPGTLVAIDG